MKDTYTQDSPRLVRVLCYPSTHRAMPSLSSGEVVMRSLMRRDADAPPDAVPELELVLTHTEIMEGAVHKYFCAVRSEDGTVDEDDPDKLDGVVRACGGRLTDEYPPDGSIVAVYTTVELTMAQIGGEELEVWIRRTKTRLDKDYAAPIELTRKLLRRFTHPGQDEEAPEDLYSYELVALKSVELTTLAWDPTARAYVIERRAREPRVASNARHAMSVTDAALAHKHALVMVTCEPGTSLLYAVASALRDSINPQRVAQYRRRIGQMTTAGMIVPYGLDDVDRLTRANPELPPITVHGWSVDDSEARVLRQPLTSTIDERTTCPEHLRRGGIHLMFVDDKFYWLKTLSRLYGAGGGIGRPDEIARPGDRKICPMCCRTFAHNAGAAHTEHVAKCRGVDRELDRETIEKMPAEGKCLRWRASLKDTMAPVVVYIDFEARFEEVDSETKLTTMHADGRAKQVAHGRLSKEHKPVSYGMYVESRIPWDLPTYFQYVGDDAASHLLDTLLWTIVPYTEGFLEAYPDLDDSVYERAAAYREGEEAAGRPLTCGFCRREFTAHDIVYNYAIHHDHELNEFRCFAHKTENLLAQRRSRSPSVLALIHHGEGYDNNFILPAAVQHTPKIHVIHTILRGSSRFRGLQLSLDLKGGGVQFHDSCAHLTASLDKLLGRLASDRKTRLRSWVNILMTSATALEGLREYFGEPQEELRELLMKLLGRKLVFPYKVVTSAASLDVPIPTDPEAYRSDLTGEIECDLELLWVACRVLGLTTLRELHDVYLRVDVLGLADVFEDHRARSFADHGLDAAQFLGAPSFAEAQMYKHTGGVFMLLTDKEMYVMCEGGKRGGYSATLYDRPVKVNNPLMPGYDSMRPSTWLYYFDQNNQYAKALTYPMPCCDFRWGIPDEFDVKADYTGESGAIVEVTLDYPRFVEDKEHPLFGTDLHEAHQVPLAPETMMVSWNMLSPATRARMGEKVVQRKTPQKRLITHFGPRVRYVCDVRRLQYLLGRGLKLVAVHRVILFTQRPWMKPYIDFNNMRRTEAKRIGDDAGVGVYKLMNVSVSGKTMENKRNRTKVAFVDSARRLKALVKKGVVKDVVSLGDDQEAMVVTKKESCVLDAAMPVAVCLLDMAKTLLDQADERIVNAFASRKGHVTKLYTDTDSLVYHIDHPKPEAVMVELLGDVFDFSNLPKSHPLFSTAHENELGCMKDENPGYVMTSWQAPQVKCYRGDCVMDPRCEAELLAKKLGPKCQTQAEAKKALQKAMVGSFMKTKGAPAKAAAQQMSAADFEDLRRRRKAVEYTKIRGMHTRLFNETCNRVVLSFTDGKQYWFEDGTSLPFGHHAIPQTPHAEEDTADTLATVMHGLETLLEEASDSDDAVFDVNETDFEVDSDAD